MRTLPGLAIFLTAVACSAPREHVPLPAWLEREREEYRALLDDLGAPAPGSGGVTLRFVWNAPPHDVFVITIGLDEQTPWLQSDRRDRTTQRWRRTPREPIAVSDFAAVMEAAAGERDWRDPGNTDGSTWLFTGAGWSAFRRSPERGSPWWQVGTQLVELAKRDDLRVSDLR